MADNTENTQQVLQGTFYGYIKCSYVHICAKDRQLLFSFQRGMGDDVKPTVYAKNVQYGIDRQEAYLTIYARQRFLQVLEDAGWCIDSTGQLAEIPVYEKVQVYTSPHYEIDASGAVVVRDKIEKTVRKKYTDARHIKMYEYALLLLPYIMNPATPVYVRSNAINWSINDVYGNKVAEQEAAEQALLDAEQAKQAAIAEAERLRKQAKRTKTLGILTAIATILTTK